VSRSGCACIKPKLATASANSKMPGIITWRVPKRSISQPITGHDTATNQVLAPNAPDSSPRLTPRSSVTGLRNTPKVKIRIAPAPTKRPQAQANTIHQRPGRVEALEGFQLPGLAGKPGYGLMFMLFNIGTGMGPALSGRAFDRFHSYSHGSVLVQHAVGKDAIGIELLIATAFDGAEVGADQRVARSG